MSEETKKWAKVRKSVGITLGIFGVAATAFSYWYFQPLSGVVTFATICCLALGFWLTEMLVGVFTRVKQANPTAIVLLFTGKIVWWGGIFVLSKQIEPGHEGAIAIGMGTFLLALLVGGISHYGLPKISDAKTSGEP